MIQYQVQSSLFLIGAITSLVTLTTLSRAYWQRPINDLEDNRNHLWNLLSCWYMSRPSIWYISRPTVMKDSILYRYCLVQFFFEFMFSCWCILNHKPYGTCLDQQPSVFWLVSPGIIGWNFLDLFYLSFVTCTFPGWWHIPNAWRSSAQAFFRLVNQSLLSCSALLFSLLYHFSLLYLHLSSPPFSSLD